MAINLDLTENEVNAVLTSLAQQPYNQVATLIEKIRVQGMSQLKAAEEEPEVLPPLDKLE